MSGFSESIFKVLASTSKSGCLSDFVDQIDRKFNLFSQPHAMKSQLPMADQFQSQSGILGRKTVKIFVSSTFKDMHSERNLMSQFIFPEIMRRAKSLGLGKLHQTLSGLFRPFQTISEFQTL